MSLSFFMMRSQYFKKVSFGKTYVLSLILTEIQPQNESFKE
jgi:hypothetical protein